MHSIFLTWPDLVPFKGGRPYGYHGRPVVRRDLFSPRNKVYSTPPHPRDIFRCLSYGHFEIKQKGCLARRDSALFSCGSELGMGRCCEKCSQGLRRKRDRRSRNGLTLCRRCYDEEEKGPSGSVPRGGSTQPQRSSGDASADQQQGRQGVEEGRQGACWIIFVLYFIFGDFREQPVSLAWLTGGVVCRPA